MIFKHFVLVFSGNISISKVVSYRQLESVNGIHVKVRNLGYWMIEEV